MPLKTSKFLLGISKVTPQNFRLWSPDIVDSWFALVRHPRFALENLHCWVRSCQIRILLKIQSFCWWSPPKNRWSTAPFGCPFRTCQSGTPCRPGWFECRQESEELLGTPGRSPGAWMSLGGNLSIEVTIWSMYYDGVSRCNHYHLVVTNIAMENHHV